MKFIIIFNRQQGTFYFAEERGEDIWQPFVERASLCSERYVMKKLNLIGLTVGESLQVKRVS